VRGLAAMLKQRGGAMNLRLDPPDLGQVRVQMTLSRGTVAAEFHASTPQAHQLLEKNLSMLRTTLEQQGLTVERLTVAHVPSSAAQHALRDESQPQQQHSQRSQHDAAGSESRGRREHTDDSPRRHSMVDFMNMLEEFQLP
jgi:flagellar hook-length control protein FliK